MEREKKKFHKKMAWNKNGQWVLALVTRVQVKIYSYRYITILKWKKYIYTSRS